jgi:hypothetical protein
MQIVVCKEVELGLTTCSLFAQVPKKREGEQIADCRLQISHRGGGEGRPCRGKLLENQVTRAQFGEITLQNENAKGPFRALGSGQIADCRL